MYLQETQDTSKYVDSPALMGWPALVYEIKIKKMIYQVINHSYKQKKPNF